MSFEKPSVISRHQDLTATSEPWVQVVRELIEATSGMAGPPRTEVPPPPRSRRLDD